MAEQQVLYVHGFDVCMSCCFHSFRKATQTRQHKTENGTYHKILFSSEGNKVAFDTGQKRFIKHQVRQRNTGSVRVAKGDGSSETWGLATRLAHMPSIGFDLSRWMAQGEQCIVGVFREGLRCEKGDVRDGKGSRC